MAGSGSRDGQFSHHVGSPDSRPSPMNKYLLEVDQYKAFLAGQDQAAPKRGKAMARYIHDWERKWERLAGDGNLQRKPKL